MSDPALRRFRDLFEQTFRSSRYGLGAAVATFMLVLSIPIVLPYLISVLREEKE